MSTYFTNSKFKNIKQSYKGMLFDSKSELMYYQILEYMLANGKIKQIRRQVKYPLPDLNGDLRCRYIADFVVTGLLGTEYIIDVKGIITPEMKTKISFAQYYHNIKIHIVFSTGLEKFRTDFIV